MAAWVDFPVPSPPSKVMNFPRIGKNSIGPPDSRLAPKPLASGTKPYESDIYRNVLREKLRQDSARPRQYRPPRLTAHPLPPAMWKITACRRRRETGRSS